jgi:hypothetical protein
LADLKVKPAAEPYLQIARVLNLAKSDKIYDEKQASKTTA